MLPGLIGSVVPMLWTFALKPCVSAVKLNAERASDDFLLNAHATIVNIYITPSTLRLLPGISVYTGTKCRAKLRYYNLARSILVLQFEVDQALHLARANLAPHFT